MAVVVEVVKLADEAGEDRAFPRADFFLPAGVEYETGVDVEVLADVGVL